eukprot:3267669-Prymnesium_polylepis.1
MVRNGPCMKACGSRRAGVSAMALASSCDVARRWAVRGHRAVRVRLPREENGAKQGAVAVCTSDRRARASDAGDLD